VRITELHGDIGHDVDEVGVVSVSLEAVGSSILREQVRGLPVGLQDHHGLVLLPIDLVDDDGTDDEKEKFFEEPHLYGSVTQKRMVPNAAPCPSLSTRDAFCSIFRKDFGRQNSIFSLFFSGMSLSRRPQIYLWSTCDLHRRITVLRTAHTWDTVLVVFEDHLATETSPT
jgi:hypothetical protein